MSPPAIEKLHAAGKTEAEVLAMQPLKDLDAKWASNEAQWQGHTKNVYQSFNRF